MSDPSATVPVVITVSAAAIYALVAAADAALGSLTPSRLAVLRDQAPPDKRPRLERFLEEPGRIQGRWLAARVLSCAVATSGAYELLAGVPEPYRPWAAVGVVWLLLSLLSEVTMAVARARVTTVGVWLMTALRPLELVVMPLSKPLSLLGRLVGALIPAKPVQEDEPKMAEAEVEQMVQEAAAAGQLEPEPAEMIRNVLDLKDLTVRDVMVPRIKIVGIEADTPLREVVQTVAREAHSRYPVYAQSIDNIVGLLYAKDLLPLLDSSELGGKTLREIMHSPVNFVPDTQPVATVLRDMRSRRQHMAVLVDEFGGISGLVTLEDLLERIVGDIRDEYDPEEAPIQDLGNGRLLADAAVSLSDLSTYLGTDIQGDGDYGSLGGLLMHEAGRVPAVGESIVASGLEFIIRDGDARHILKVEILLPPPSISNGSSQHPPAVSS